MRVQRLRVENTTKFSIIFVAKTLVKKFIEIAKAKKMYNNTCTIRKFERSLSKARKKPKLRKKNLSEERKQTKSGRWSKKLAKNFQFTKRNRSRLESNSQICGLKQGFYHFAKCA